MSRRVTFVCVGQEPKDSAALQTQCSAGWQVDVDSDTPLVNLRCNCPRCHSPKNVRVAGALSVIQL